MATKTFEELKQMAIQIRDEKTNKQNTATRIGTQMLEHLNKLEQEYYNKENIDEQKKQTDTKFSELESNTNYITNATSLLNPIKLISLSIGEEEIQNLYLLYFFYFEPSYDSRCNLVFYSEELGNIESSGTWERDGGIKRLPLVSTTQGKKYYGQIVGYADIDLNVSKYTTLTGYGVYNSDNSNNFNLKPICFSGIDDTSNNTYNTLSSKFIKNEFDTIFKGISLYSNDIPSDKTFIKAIKDIAVYFNTNVNVPTLALAYFWKNIDGNTLIRLDEYTESGYQLYAQLNVQNYSPTSDVEDIWLKDNSIKISVDWRLINDGDKFVGPALQLKKSCYKFQNLSEGIVMTDPYKTMSNFIDCFLNAKYFAPSYNDYLNSQFVLAYFWKNYGEDKSCLIRIRQKSPIVNDNFASIQWTNQEDTIEEYYLGNNNEFYFKIDWSKVPDGTVWNGEGRFAKILFKSGNTSQLSESYSNKDTIQKLITVKQDGTGDYETIGDAYASIKDSNYENQYEIVVYPGIYNEYNLIPPAYTHTHALQLGTVTVTSKNWANQGDTLPVFDQRNHPSKLSNLIIESWTGYCVHYDVALNGVMLQNTNLHLIKQHYEGAAMNVIGGGSFYYGAKYNWISCIFECVGAIGDASCHTQANSTNENTDLNFINCSYINCYPRIGSVGGFGKCTCNISGINFPYGISSLVSWFSKLRNNEDAKTYLANRVEWNITGGYNKNFAPTITNEIETIVIKADNPISISGNAVDAIFGNNYEVNNDVIAEEKCTITSMYYIKDEQAGLEPYSTPKDVFQLWKRLGDCSVENKTLTVSVNGVQKTYTFNRNYLSEKTAENIIISDMQAVLTNCTIEHLSDHSSIAYGKINTTEKIYISAKADLQYGLFITKDGSKAINTTPVNMIAGSVVKNTKSGKIAPVWTSAMYIEALNKDGEVGLDSSGNLSYDASIKIGCAVNKYFYPYY